MNLILSVIIGYALGCVNPAFIIAKVKGFDIRQRGSGNAGASNALITLGGIFGVICALIDIGKSAGAFLLCKKLFDDPRAAALAGAACILGHIFPAPMKFRGGKGLACVAGVLIAYDPLVFLIALGVEAVLVLITDYICIVSVTAAVFVPVWFLIKGEPVLSVIALAIAGIASVSRHAENFRRIKDGIEIRFSYIWKKDSETERIKKTLPDDEK